MTKQKVTTRKNGSKRVQTVIEGPSKTRKSQQAQTDINAIIRKYDKTGSLVHVTKSIPRFDDVSGMADYKTALDTVLEAQSKFGELPSEVRSHFENDPHKLIEFLNNPENQSEAFKLGLIEKADSNLDGVVDAAEKAAQAQKDQAKESEASKDQ